MMEGGGNVTINRVEDGQGREEGGGRHNNYFEAQASNIGSFDDKFINARWEYSLQMMNCGGSNAIGAVINVS
jgi:hypothetical protein